MSTNAQAPDGARGSEVSLANGTAQAPAPEKKLTNAEMKKKQKEEKQARRAAQKKDAGGSPDQQKSEQPSLKHEQSQKKHSSPKSTPEKQSPKPEQAQQQTLKARRGSGARRKSDVTPRKQVGLFGHLYGNPRRHATQGAGKDIHPAILALGLQLSSYEICGSNSRCVAMLLALKQASNTRKAV